MRPSFLLLLGLLACRSAPSQPDPAQPITEVCVLGMIHREHVDSTAWGLEAVLETLRALEPDAVLCEIPPDRLPRAMEEFRRLGRIEEPRVARFPEYTGVLFPLQADLGFEIVPCAAWTEEMALERQAKLEGWRTSRAEDTARVEEAQRRAGEAQAALGPVDDPYVIHSDAYDELVRQGMRPYDELFNEDLGPGGWTNINAAHWALLEAALEERRGQRLVITFGAWHKYWFLDRLRDRSDVHLLDPTDYLPAGS